MRSFIIHMAGNPQRAQNLARLLDRLPDAQVLEACDGRAMLARGDACAQPGNLFAPPYPFALGGGELGCFLSHRKAWQRIVDEGLDWVLIAEDDMALDPARWPGALALARAHMRPDRVIRLPAKLREKPARQIAQSGEARLFLPKRIGLQTVCQIVGRVAAQRLLDASAAIDRPVDTFMQMHWATGQPVLTLWPSGVRELTDELGGSTIQHRRPAAGKLRREVLRSLYRARVAMRPQHAAP